MFAFGATGKDAIKLFKNETETAKQMIDNEKERDILYGTIVYGKDAFVESKFNDMPDKTDVKKSIGGLSWKDDGKKLDHVLLETDKLFKDHGRPKARKILVVFVTGKADSTTEELKKAAKKLNDNDVKIIAVKLGTDPDDKQLETITPKKNIVKLRENGDSKKSSKLIDAQTKKGMKMQSKTK